MKLCVDLQELAEIANNRMKTLFISCVGSHMWGMQSQESDIDLVMIYIAPTRAILRGERISPTVRQQITARGGEIYDTLGWEIGHLINQLIKGNVNAIWYVTSPLVIKPSSIQEELSALVQANLCRQTYHSIKGMAESQIKSEEKPEDCGQRLQDGSENHQFRNNAPLGGQDLLCACLAYPRSRRGHGKDAPAGRGI